MLAITPERWRAALSQIMEASVGAISELVTSDSSSTVLFIGVMTAPGNVARRKEIRETWMRHEMLTKPDTPIIQSRFIVGIPEPGSDVESELALDMEMHDDILQLPSPEGYHNLPNKSVAFFRWFAEHGKAAFAMKLDDDTFPDLDRIISILQAKVENHKYYTYLGNMLVNRRPMDHGKWKQNPLVYPEEFYPKYAAGPGYILRRDLIDFAFKEHYDENIKLMLDNEDVNVGVWVDRAKDSGIPVDYQHLEANEEECKPKDSLAMNLDLGVISCMWSRQMAGEFDTCCGHEKFDWRMRADALEGQAFFLRGQARRLRGDPSESIFHLPEGRLHSSEGHRHRRKKHRRSHRTLRTRSK